MGEGDTTRSSAEAALDALSDAVVVCEPDHTIAHLNEAAERLFGAGRAHFVGQRVDALLPERVRVVDERPFVEWLLARHRAGGRSVRAPIRRADGVEIHRAFRLTTVTRKDGAAIVIVLQAPHDEHDADPLHVDALAVAAESTYRAVFAAVPVGILHFDARGIITAANDVVIAYLGSERERLVGLDMLTLHNAAVVAAVREALAGGEGHFEGEYHSATGGTRRMYRAHFSPILREGVVAGGVGIVEDVSERRRIATQLAQGERMASLGRLAAGVAHEINNPLAYVRTSLELARREIAGLREPGDGERLARLEELIGHATDGVERVRVIANDLKTFSRGDEGSWLPVDLNRVVESAINLAHNEIRHRAELTIERGDVAPVMGSETRFVQVLVNLLVNAAQAIPEGHAADNRIAVRTGTASQTVWVEVEDTGHGIAPELVDHIFEPFWTNKPDVGIGLGLSICHGIVSAAGGVIRVVESRPGRTVFRIELPAAPHDAPPREVRTPPPPSAPASQARILIVDDELKLARTLAIALGERFHVDIATNGREALAKLGDGGTYDLVLCDLMMPELSGMDLYETLIAERPSLARRIVFMTGGAFTDRAREFLKRGGIRRLEKPFSIEAVEALLLEPR